VDQRRSDHRIDSQLRVIAFVIGMALAAGVVAASLIPAGAGALGADVTMVVAPTGELAVKRSGIVLDGNGLTPASDPVTGRLQLLNQTGAALGVRFRGVANAPGLDRALWISVAGPEGNWLYRGPLGGFGDWTHETTVLEPGRWSTFDLEAWIPDDADPTYAGRVAQVDLAFRANPEPTR
jgi:hypothetical protein